MKFSERIEKIGSECDACDLFADIGCDHGYSTAYMLEKGLCRRAQISDISAKSLSKAEKLLKKYVDEGRVSSVCAAGMEKTDPSADFVLIAGMGGEEIVHILQAGFLPPKLLLQPMKNADKVRAFLLAAGYSVLRDYTFLCGGKFYDLIKAEKGIPSDYTQRMLAYGRDNLEAPTGDFVKKLERDIADCERWLAPVRTRGREALSARLADLKEVYGEVTADLCGDRRRLS